MSFLKALFFTVAIAVNFPKPVGLVNDFALLFSENFRSRLELQLSDLKTKTTIEFAVVTVKNLENLTVEEYANGLFASWGIGQKDKDNGLLLLISKDDKKIRFETGYGLEGSLPDGRLGEIIRTQISPEFKKGDYEAGTLAAVNKIAEILADPSVSSDTSETKTDAVETIFGIGFLIYIIYLVVVYFAAFLGRSKEFYLGGMIGFAVGLIIGVFTLSLIFGLLGLILDYILSKNYKYYKKQNLPTSFWSSRGGFGSGGGGGFGGFGGGRSGGGGASGGW